MMISLRKVPSASVRKSGSLTQILPVCGLGGYWQIRGRLGTDSTSLSVTSSVSDDRAVKILAGVMERNEACCSWSPRPSVTVLVSTVDHPIP